jgi:hypothetical protein
MKRPDFHGINDEQLVQWMQSNPDNYDFPGALFEHQRRQSLRMDEIEGLRHRKTQRVAWIAAILSCSTFLVCVIDYWDQILRLFRALRFWR